MLALAMTILLSEDFDAIPDGRLPPGWTAPAEGWAVSGGKLRGEPAAAREAVILFGDPAWRDLAVELEAAFEGGGAGQLAILLREGSGDKPGIQLALRHGGRRGDELEISARRAPPDAGLRVFQRVKAPAAGAAGAARRLRIEAQGPWIRGWLDGERIIQSPRGGEAASAGRCALRVSGAAVAIDRVRVERLEPAQPEKAPIPRARPLAVAHRGFSHIAPENTLVAYRKAIELGVEMAECDVHLSADRVPVIIHDEDLARTTNGRGKVGDFTAGELRELDAGSWKGPEFRGERIPTLREALELVKGKLRFVIEIKGKGMEKEVVEAIRASGAAPEEVLIFGFDFETVRAIQTIEPHLPTTWLIDDLPPRAAGRTEVIRRALGARFSALGLSRDQVDPDFIRQAHECGFPIFVWTADDPADMRYLIRAGADAIISNRPDLLLDILDQK